jgi:hypothetical protein
MRRTTIMAALVLGVATGAHAGLDCARVREMNAQGTRASEIARALGLTTPDVQACLAGVVEEPVANQASKLPLSPQVPAGDGPIRRGPEGQED